MAPRDTAAAQHTEGAAHAPPSLLMRWHDTQAFVAHLDAVGFHTHRTTAMLIALDGAISVRTTLSGWQRCSGALIAAGVRHALDCGGRRLAVMYLDPLHNVLRNTDFATTQGIHLATDATDWVRLGRDLIDTATTRTGDAHALRTALHEELLPRCGVRRSNQRDTRLLSLHRLIEQRNGATLSLPHAARALHLSESRFSHLFRQQVGIAWTAYRNWNRLVHSCVDLSAGPTPLTDIALRQGYSSSAHFASSFRAGFGVTPSQLRQMRLRIEEHATADI